MSANTGLAKKLARAETLSQQVLDLARRGQRDEDDLGCLILVLQKLKDGHLHEVRVTPRLSEEELARRGETRISRLIDCDAPPYLPEAWEIWPEDQLASAVRGKLKFDPAKVVFHLSEAQKIGRIVGTELRQQLKGKPVLPANVLDALLANTALIPESWKLDEHGNTRHIYFWGTIYRGHGVDLCVRYLYWDDGQWDWLYLFLALEFDARDPAALLASPV